jgi:hypothetical protein
MVGVLHESDWLGPMLGLLSRHHASRRHDGLLCAVHCFDSRIVDVRSFGVFQSFGVSEFRRKKLTDGGATENPATDNRQPQLANLRAIGCQSHEELTTTRY